MTTIGAFEAAVAARIARRDAAVARDPGGPVGTFEEYVSSRIARATTATEAWQRTADMLARRRLYKPPPPPSLPPSLPRARKRLPDWSPANSRERRRRVEFVASILETIVAHGIDPDVAITALEQLPTRRERYAAAMRIANDTL